MERDVEQPEKITEFCGLPLLPNTFDSLPYLMTETDWIEVTKCKRLAVIKEEQLLEIRKKRYEQLLLDVSNKLERRTDKKHVMNQDIIDNKSRKSKVISQSVKVSGIPVRSPPKNTQIQQLHPKDQHSQESRTIHATGYQSHALKHSSHITNSVDRFGALVKGYMTRRLLTSEKIQDIVKTIKDAEHVLQDLESPSTIQEFDLQQRVITQLQAAKHKLHFIFFEATPKDKMAYIAHSRIFRREKRLKRLEALQDEPSGLQGRLSTATLKSIERKKKDSPINPRISSTKRQAIKKQKEETKEVNKVKHEVNTGRKHIGSGTSQSSSSGANVAVRKKTTFTSSKVKQSHTTSTTSKNNSNTATKIPSIRTRNPKLK